MSMDQVAKERSLNMVDQHMGYTSNLAPGTNPDEAGAKSSVYFLKYPFSVVKRGTDEVVSYPEKVISTVRWRAVEMAMNRDGRIISEEEAAPYLARQAIEEEKAAIEAKRVADLMKEESESDSKVKELEAKIASQDAKLDKLLELLASKS